MLLHTECFNPYHTNCYFLTDEESGSTVIIDPGCYFRRERTRVQHLIRLNDWHIVQILATHLHIDHIFGVHFLTKAYGCPFGASPLDNDWIDRAPDRCREVGLEVRMPFVSPTFSLAHGDTVRFGSRRKPCYFNFILQRILPVMSCHNNAGYPLLSDSAVLLSLPH